MMHTSAGSIARSSEIWRSWKRFRPLSGKEVSHQHLDSAYVTQMAGHFYLVAYHSERGQLLEFRIDRIQEQPLQIKPQLTGTATIRPRSPTVWPVLSPLARSGRQTRPKHLGG